MVVRCGLVLSLAATSACFAIEPTPAAVGAFDAYARTVEARLGNPSCSPNRSFPGSTPAAGDQARLRRGELIVESIPLTGGTPHPGALLSHWRGRAFISGATTGDFERLLQDFDDYPRYFVPQVIQARVLSRDGDHLSAAMRIVQHHILTVTMDTAYDITFRRVDPQCGSSISRSTSIAEIGSNGRPLQSSEEHGFLWRLNTYWNYEERDSGLYIQIETISLTRSVPAGLGWLIGAYVESIPRESLEFTLRSVCHALQQERK